MTRITLIVLSANVLGAIVLGASLLVGCDDDSMEPSEQLTSPPEDTEADVASDTYVEVELDDAGSVAGHLRWVGERPEVEQFEVSRDREVCGETQPSRALRVSEGGGVADAVVSLDNVRAGPAAPPAQPVLAQRGCRFEPHVQVAMVGQRVRFGNEDPLLHNLRAFDGEGATVFDIGFPRAGATARRTVENPGPLRVVCDAGHTFQFAWIHVFSHPYATTTDAEGRFRLLEVPPGRYTVRVWHEGWRVVGSARGRPRMSSPVVLSRTLSVSPRQETTVDFTLGQASAEIAGD